jgi:hypothetical protein
MMARKDSTHTAGGMVRISSWIPEIYMANLREIAADAGCDVADLLRMAVRAYLKNKGKDV